MTKPTTTDHISQLTGRRRKLSDGAMIDICKQFASGASVQTISKQYGVSTHTIYSVVYWTPRKAPVEQLKRVNDNEQEFIQRVKAAYDNFIEQGVEFSTNDILMEVGYGTPGEVTRALGKVSH